MEPNNIVQEQVPVSTSTPPVSVPSVPPPTQAPVRARLEGPISLLKSAWGLFRSHWKVLSIIVGIPPVFILISQLLSETKNIPLAIVGIILMIAGIVLSIAMSVASIDAIRKLYANPTEIINIKGEYKYGFSMFWPLIVVYILHVFATMGASIFLIIPGIIVAVYLAMTTYVFVIEGKKGLDVLAESYGLIKSYWWAVLGRVIVLGVFMFVVSFISTFIITIVLLVVSKLISNGNVDLYIVSTILSFILNVILGVISGAYMYRLYESLKANRNPSVDVSKARKWFKALAIIGPLVIIISIVASIVLVSLNSARNISKNAQLQAQLQNQNINLELNDTTK